jgi:hypothetical protein
MMHCLKLLEMGDVKVMLVSAGVCLRWVCKALQLKFLR